jgi:zinc transport system ATP-binding protein
MSGKEIVSINDVWVSFGGISVLEDITLSITDKDFLAIIGPNGSGKTTLLKVILGLIKPDRGTVEVFGMAPAEGRKLVGYLPQRSRFDPSFPINVFDAVLMGRYRGLFKGYTEEDRARAEDALATLGMLEHRDRQIGELSGGQVKRAFIARALVKEPRLLILDEPMASIDPEMQKSFYDMLSELRKSMAVVLVTHDVGVISTHVDQIACVSKRIFYHGSAEEGLGEIEKAYKCPVDLVSHGVPHRVFRGHEKGVDKGEKR